jgi:hypothetical protein
MEDIMTKTTREQLERQFETILESAIKTTEVLSISPTPDTLEIELIIDDASIKAGLPVGWNVF